MEFEIKHHMSTVDEDNIPVNISSVSGDFFPQAMKPSVCEEGETKNSVQHLIKYGYDAMNMENQTSLNNYMDPLENPDTEETEIKIDDFLMHQGTSDINTSLERSPINTSYFENKIKVQIPMEESKELTLDLLSTRSVEITASEENENLPPAVQAYKHDKSRSFGQNTNSFSEEMEIKHIRRCYFTRQGKDITCKSSLADRAKRSRTNKCSDLRSIASSSNETIRNLANNNDTRTRFRCVTCTKSFSIYNNYQRHKESGACQKYICHYCKKVIPYAANMKRHIATHTRVTGEDLYTCTHCMKSFSRTDYLIFHIRTHTVGNKLDFAKKNLKKQNSKARIRTYNRDNLFMCDHCGKGYLRKESLLGHIPKHTGDFPFSCNHCSKKFSRKFCLTTHIQLSHMQTQETNGTSPSFKPFQCDHCIRSYSYKPDLRKHIIHAHLDIKSHICNECGKVFPLKNALTRHVLTHSKIKPFKCNECGRSFTRKCSLKLHTEVIHGSRKLKPIKQRQFICEFCGKCVSSKMHLQIHIRTHTNEKPFGCNFCHKTCSAKVNLKQHIRRHLQNSTSLIM